MRRAGRLVAVLGLVAALSLAFVLVGARNDDGPVTYKLQLDNSFGLTEGSELRVAGVKAGTVQKMSLDKRRMLAELELEVTARGFGDLRRDVWCQTRPQSLIGEYFIDCQPGRSPERLPAGGTIPVRQTNSVVPPDLIANIMRRPYRERFSILISELGMGLAGRGRDLNETIRRANPALREVNRVLRVLARERSTIRELYRRADTVLAAVARRRRDVGRFFVEARDTSRAYANRSGDVDRQFRLLPTFLDQLRPTLAALEGTAEAQRPALESLRVAARPLSTLLRTSAGFSSASLPAVRRMADLSRTGRRAVTRALPNLRRLSTAVRPLPETAGNLGIILDHINDPKWATERDPRSPRGGSGYTGIESLMRFFYLSSQTTNWFDEDSYLIKILQFTDDECALYADAERARKVSGRCHAWLGRNQPGVTTPDPTRGSTAPSAEDEEGGGTEGSEGSEPAGAGTAALRTRGGAGGAAADPQAEDALMDYLFTR